MRNLFDFRFLVLLKPDVIPLNVWVIEFGVVTVVIVRNQIMQGRFPICIIQGR